MATNHSCVAVRHHFKESLNDHQMHNQMFISAASARRPPCLTRKAKGVGGPVKPSRLPDTKVMVEHLDVFCDVMRGSAPILNQTAKFGSQCQGNLYGMDSKNKCPSQNHKPSTDSADSTYVIFFIFFNRLTSQHFSGKNSPTQSCSCHRSTN